mmetsp:Transcript_29205/g.61791  ORF Transcript_29205/g.61791 Transcript_29205/m.61791 type:complete len:237 (+) Transcript_29205:74-784(+)
MQVLRPEREQTSREPSARLTLHEPDGQLGSEPVRDEEGGKDARQEADAPPLVVVNELSRRGVVVSLWKEGENGRPEVVVDGIDVHWRASELEHVLVTSEGRVEELDVWRVSDNTGQAWAGGLEDCVCALCWDGHYAAHNVVDVQIWLAFDVVEVCREPKNLIDAPRILHATAEINPGIPELVDHERTKGPSHVGNEAGPSPPDWHLGQETHDGDIQQSVHSHGTDRNLKGRKWCRH